MSPRPGVRLTRYYRGYRVVFDGPTRDRAVTIFPYSQTSGVRSVAMTKSEWDEAKRKEGSAEAACRALTGEKSITV